MPVSEGWCRAGVPQAALAFREPGWCRPAVLQARQQLMPPLPLGLVPVAVAAPDPALEDEAGKGLRLRLLNPGARRQLWRPQGWSLRQGDGALVDAITFKPGELAEVELVPDDG